MVSRQEQVDMTNLRLSRQRAGSGKKGIDPEDSPGSARLNGLGQGLRAVDQKDPLIAETFAYQ
jgi:hypothetical protein